MAITVPLCALLGARQNAHQTLGGVCILLVSSRFSDDNPHSNPILRESKQLGLCSESDEQPLIYCHTNNGCCYPHVKVNVQQRQLSKKNTATQSSCCHCDATFSANTAQIKGSFSKAWGITWGCWWWLHKINNKSRALPHFLLQSQLGTKVWSVHNMCKSIQVAHPICM